MKEVTELAYILNYLEAVKHIDMQQVAVDMKRSYDYIRGEKNKIDPSKKLIELIQITYADQLKELPAYKDSPYIKDREQGSGITVNEDAAKYNTRQNHLTEWMAEKEARLLEAQQRAAIAEAEKDRLLTIIDNLTKNQQAGSLPKNDATGNQGSEKDKE